MSHLIGKMDKESLVRNPHNEHMVSSWGDVVLLATPSIAVEFLGNGD
jgi:hypothetical protein